MAEIELFCIIESVPAGLLWQDAAGLIFFRYADDYQGIPLSLSMPITNRTYGQKTVGPYLFGLLPDREEQRRAMAREYGGRPNNAVTLLAHIGMERVLSGTRASQAWMSCENTYWDQLRGTAIRRWSCSAD